jgi:chemotaxis protein MotB
LAGWQLQVAAHSPEDGVFLVEHARQARRFVRPSPRFAYREVPIMKIKAWIVAMGLLGVGCGYSEDEWQAQLGRYGKLESEHANEKKAHAADAEVLEKAKQRVRDLISELEKAGVSADELNQRLQQEGTEKERLAADLDQMRRALEEYKQRAAQLERIKQRFEVLRGKLQKLTNLGLKVQIRHNRMVISLPGDVLFASGKDELRDEGKQVILAVAEVIRSDAQLNARYFQVAGHTDNKPLKYNVKFIDNWGLSAMRARQVLVYLVAPVNAKEGGGGLDARRLHAAGYGDTDPVAANDTDVNLQANRRVELVLLPDVEEMLDLKSLL